VIYFLRLVVSFIRLEHFCVFLVIVMIVVAFDGTKVVLREERWRHIVLRHPELKGKRNMVLDVVSSPDEVYVDLTGAVHALKRIVGEISDYLVVVYSKEDGEGY